MSHYYKPTLLSLKLFILIKVSIYLIIHAYSYTNLYLSLNIYLKLYGYPVSALDGVSKCDMVSGLVTGQCQRVSVSDSPCEEPEPEPSPILAPTRQTPGNGRFRAGQAYGGNIQHLKGVTITKCMCYRLFCHPKAQIINL